MLVAITFLRCSFPHLSLRNERCHRAIIYRFRFIYNQNISTLARCPDIFRAEKLCFLLQGPATTAQSRRAAAKSG